MNETWRKTAKRYIKCYEAIITLSDYNLVDSDVLDESCRKLLLEIIAAFRGEVENGCN